MVPWPGRKRTRATACLRRPVAWTSGFGMNLLRSGRPAGRGRQLERTGQLGGVRVLWPRVHLQLGEHLPAERALRQHALYGGPDELFRLAAPDLGETGRPEASRVAAVPVREGLLGLVGRKDDLGGVDDDDVVTGVEGR